jgi:ATP-dependent Lhr-like helicase
VASRFGSFPILLETYRECLRDVFDMPALVEILRQIAARRLRLRTVDSRTPSPFAASLLFSYVANFIYDGDAPLAERRAQALTVDPAQLRELLGEAELRELLDGEAIVELERSLQRLDGRRPATSADSLHDMLLSMGDLTEDEIRARSEPPEAASAWIAELEQARRVVRFNVIDRGREAQRRFAAAEDAARLRDALGIVPPQGLPKALLEPVADPLGDIVARYSRTHGPFLADSVAARFGLGIGPVLDTLRRLAAMDRVVEGEFLPGGRSREWCDVEVLRSLKRRSLAKLRKEIEPVEPAALGRFVVDWHGLKRPRPGVDALLSAVEQLQGAPIPASVLEADILPARVADFRPADLDLLCAAGEVVWVGIESLGPNDGRVALYLTDQLPLLAPPPRLAEGELAGAVRELLKGRGALFFSDMVATTGAFPPDLLSALWDLVWSGEVTNDTLAPLRSFLRQSRGSKDAGKRTTFRGRTFRSRRAGPPGSEGRWSLVNRASAPKETERRTALTRALLERHGVLTREAVHAEGIEGGFSAIYDVLKAMEEAGRLRRGYFIAGLGATQFALPGADDRLRSVRERSEEPQAIVLAATDPANPFGAALAWPEKQGARPQRAAGAFVVLLDGALCAYIGRAERSLLTFLPAEEPERGHAAKALVGALAGVVEQGRRRTLLIAQIDGSPAETSPLAPHLSAAGFTPTSRGFFKRAPGRREA